jgi:hypothetical protein
MSTQRIVTIVLAAGASGVALARLLRMRRLLRSQKRSAESGYRVPIGRFHFPRSDALYSPTIVNESQRLHKTFKEFKTFKKPLRHVNRSSPLTLPITIYLSDESVHEQVEAAVEDLLASVGGHIEHRDDPMFGSWFRRMRARVGRAARSPLAHETVTLAAHAAESRLVHVQVPGGRRVPRSACPRRSVRHRRWSERRAVVRGTAAPWRPGRSQGLRPLHCLRTWRKTPVRHPSF